jgi:nucleotide-binding universal stress UspA family protein
MSDILVPIATPSEAVRAAERAIASYRSTQARVHLLNVQRPLPRHVARFFPRQELRAFHHEAGMHALAPAIRALDAAGVPHDDHVVVGHAAEAIVAFARELGAPELVLDPVEPGLRAMLGAGSIGNQVRHLLRRATA